MESLSFLSLERVTLSLLLSLLLVLLMKVARRHYCHLDSLNVFMLFAQNYVNESESENENEDAVENTNERLDVCLFKFWIL